MKTVNDDEIEKFSRIANDWWNENGKFKPLHEINNLRVSYIVSYIKHKIKKDISDITLLDIGCGGGLASEAMARQGMKVLGIDPSHSNIKVAKNHAQESELVIDYQCTTLENLIGSKYDVILALEVVEHVDNVGFFIANACKILNEGGLIFFSTINRTVKSWMLAIVGAEYILRWLPRGTHSWRKFVKPSELVNFLRENDINLEKMNGMNYNILKDEWSITENLDVNYIAVGQLKVSS